MQEDIIIQISNRLKEIRKDRNVTLQELAEKAGITKSMLSQVENSRSIPSLSVLLGTGSVDFILTTMYNLRIGNWGINTILTYKANTAKSEYQFGNKFTGSAIGYYNIALKHINLMPNAGMMYENTAANTLSKISVAATGGYVTNAMAGVEVGIKKMNIGITGMAPVSQYYAAGQTKLNWRGDVHVSFSF